MDRSPEGHVPGRLDAHAARHDDGAAACSGGIADGGRSAASGVRGRRWEGGPWPTRYGLWPGSSYPRTANATAGVVAGEAGAPYDRPAWLSAITFADGCLADGVALTPAVDWAYFSLTRASSDLTVIGSAFATYAEEAYEAAMAHAVASGGVRARI